MGQIRNRKKRSVTNLGGRIWIQIFLTFLVLSLIQFKLPSITTIMQWVG